MHEAVADKFTEAFTARLKSLVMGPGLDEATELGPLVNEDTRSKVTELVDEAAGAGAVVVTGGRAPGRKGYFYEPTLLDGVSAEAAILNTEIFGPVAPVVRDSATRPTQIRWANATEFGLLSPTSTRRDPCGAACACPRRWNPA